MSDTSILRILANDFEEVVACLEAGHKIQAIKKLRNATEPKCGLKEAKWAVERLACERGIARPSTTTHADAPRIVCGPVIRKMILNYGHGDIELDLEGMQLKALMDMQTIGLDACRDILNLVDVLAAFSEGKGIGVLANSDHDDVVIKQQADGTAE
ncbi:MAG TPA: hypothetical protein EYG51_23980 [Pseudomonadales bacterium]|nr:hypothetical protein [Pseudomonadales bacterium]